MKLHIALISIVIVQCHCDLTSRVNRPAIVQSNVARPGDSVLDVSEPECSFQGANGQCCLTVGIAGRNGIQNCVRLGVEDGKGYAAYTFNGHEIARKDYTAGQSCFRVPNTRFLACIHVYYAEISPSGKQGNICAFVSINQVISLDFNCIRFNNGKFEHNHDHTPESQGIINVEFANGRANVLLGRPSEE